MDRSVFPTRVGVDLSRAEKLISGIRFPHTRGGGPIQFCQITVQYGFSPHAWGWTYASWTSRIELHVFPTRVGVDRPVSTGANSRASFPHTRGGGPVSSPLYGMSAEFSPHAWGWTYCTKPVAASFNVFPTRVGVDPVGQRMLHGYVGFPHTRGGGPLPDSRYDPRLRFPHTRGGGPPALPFAGMISTFSPHAWGWTEAGAPFLAWLRVFPTRVGVDLDLPYLRPDQRGFPHTRGGGPNPMSPICPHTRFSPHAWGWTYLIETMETIPSVFPTRVGVDRRS